jgi:hypothetical protein
MLGTAKGRIGAGFDPITDPAVLTRVAAVSVLGSKSVDVAQFLPRRLIRILAVRRFRPATPGPRERGRHEDYAGGPTEFEQGDIFRCSK